MAAVRWGEKPTPLSSANLVQQHSPEPALWAAITDNAAVNKGIQ